MKSVRLFLLSLLVLSAGSLYAHGGPGRQQVVSPELTAESVTFRLSANYATVVSVQTSWAGTQTMTKGEGGVWSITLPRPVPEL